MTRVVTIIQARMGSTRLPGKVLKDINGKSMLAWVVERSRGSRLSDSVVIATTDQEEDVAVVKECRKLDVPCFRGSGPDVLDRFYRTASALDVGAVVRITADCPLIDAGIMDRVIDAFLCSDADIASNGVHRTFPRGLDTSVTSYGALQTAWREATEPYQRAHVTPYLYENPERFRVVSVTNEEDLSHHRWTVDSQQDLEFVREVYARLEAKKRSSWLDVLAVLDEEPALTRINQGVRQKRIVDG